MRILICRVGQAPVLETAPNALHFEFIAAILGGDLELLHLSDGLELYCRDEGRILGLPVNRRIPAVGPQTAGFDFVIDLTGGRGAAPGQPGYHEICGDFVVLRRGGDMTEDDIARFP